MHNSAVLTKFFLFFIYSIFLFFFLPEDLRRRHPRADPLQFLGRHAVDAVPAAGILDGPDDHPPDERGDLLHALGGRIVPRDCRRRFAAVLDRGSPLRPVRTHDAEPPPSPGRGGQGEAGTRRTCRGCGCRAGLRPSDRRSSRRPGRGSPRSGRSSRTPRIARRARCGGECRRTAPRTSRGPRDSSCEESPRRPGGRGKG